MEEVNEDEKFEKGGSAATSDAVRGAAPCQVHGDVAGDCDATSGVRTSSDAAGAVATSEETR